MTLQHEDGPAAPPLSGRATRGAAWLVGARLTTKAIDFVILLVLARLLTPAQFGIIAIALPLVQIAEAVLELPVGQVLISLDRVERRHTDTAFTLGAIRGVVLAIVFALTASPAASFYGDERLLTILPVLALAPAVRGLVSPRMVLFARALDYRREFLTELTGKIAALVLSLAAALAFRDYRALIVGTLAAPAFSVLASYIVAPYRPRLSLAAWPAFAHFLTWTTATQFLSALLWQCDRLALGRFVSPERLGEYSLANDLTYVPEQALIKPIIRPLMSAFVSVRNDAERLRFGFEKAAATVMMVGLPIMIGLSVLAAPAVHLLLGEKWLKAIPILQLLPLTLIPALAIGPMPSLAMAVGQPRMVWRQQRIDASCRIPLIVAGAWLYGVPGVIAARFLGGVVASASAFYLTKQMIGTPIRHQVAGLARVLLAGAVMAITLFVLAPMLPTRAGIALAFGLVAVSTAGGAAYGAALIISWHVAGQPNGMETVVVERAKLLMRRVVRTLG